MLSGTVARDSAGTALAGAEVSVPDLKRSATANYVGEFRLDNLPAGRFAVVVRHVGFEPLVDTVTLGAGSRVDREFILLQKPTQLDPTVTTAPESKYLSPALREFVERRRQGFGHFIGEEELRKDESRDMVNIIAGQMPGLTRFRVPNHGNGGHGQIYLGTTRSCGDGPAFLACRSGGTYCPLTLYIDGVVAFNSATEKSTADIPDLTTFRATDYAGIEFYAGGAAMPVKFNMTSSGCGVLLLWTRER